MNKNIEKEFKLLVNEEQFKTLLAFYPSATFHKQVNTYYDRNDLEIRKAKGAMRIREVHDTLIFTLKLHREDGLHEYECEVEKNDPSVFENEQIQTLLMEHHLQGPFEEMASLTTYRAVIDTGYAELCFDHSYYNGHEDFEIEYEFKKDHDGLTPFNQILSQIGLHYEKNCTSKIRRALSTKK